VPILFWLVLGLEAVNSLLRPVCAHLKLGEDREFFQHPCVELDLPHFGPVLVVKEVAERARSGRLTQSDLGEFELGRRRYGIARDKGML